ncbi:hypothetical protein B0J18DRAFT_133800 [Chaetomium sp. MPI-SDFR-AT-0129]|nr:hypothetical protein B0J18DRAFT_133800 [Chaetomium sp. MPI-SDFR-AT-0129]
MEGRTERGAQDKAFPDRQRKVINPIISRCVKLKNDAQSTMERATNLGTGEPDASRITTCPFARCLAVSLAFSRHAASFFLFPPRAHPPLCHSQLACLWRDRVDEQSCLSLAFRGQDAWGHPHTSSRLTMEWESESGCGGSWTGTVLAWGPKERRHERYRRVWRSSIPSSPATSRGEKGLVRITDPLQELADSPKSHRAGSDRPAVAPSFVVAFRIRRRASGKWECLAGSGLCGRRAD